MPVEITLPELGESVEGGTLVSWLVAVGDTIDEGQAIAEISTDKVDTEVPSPRAGVVTRLVAAIDDEVAVGGVLLELEVDGATPAAAVPTEEPPVEQSVEESVEQPVEEPVAPAVERPVEQPVAAPAAVGDDQRLSPLVRRLARERDLDPSRLRGTGPAGRVTRDDVLAAAPESTAGTAGTPVAASGSRTDKLSRTRRVIAERMAQSLQTTAQLTSAVEADVTRIMELRGRVRDAARAEHGISLSPLAFLAHATVRALQQHPMLNASIDVEAGTFTTHAGVGLGIAVDAPTGLIVPVIHDAHLLGPVSLQQRIIDLADRARTKRITPDDLRGGTFTITNTGSRGSLFDTPILNPPEVGILATPAIEQRPVVITDPDGTDRIAIRHRTYLCLTYDHRLVDGADAARFLSDLARLVDSDDWGPEIDRLLG